VKRSSQVLLMVMGVTSTTALGHYLAPPRTECAQQTPGTPQDVTQPCRTTSGSRSGGHTWWSSSGSGTSGTSSSSTSTSASGATRGGFGSTGLGISSGS